MGATTEEIEDGEAEGATLHVGIAQKQIIVKDGNVSGVEYQRTKPESRMPVVVVALCLCLVLNSL